MLNPFSSITTAGLLLPLDLLTRVGSMDRALPGMTPADYHVPGSIRLNEAATAAYSRALAYWKSFRKKFDALPASDTGTTLTRDEWLLPLFDCLGYGRLQNKRAITIDNKDYPISHGWEDHVPIHLLSARLPLDKRTQNVSGAATRSPYSLVQELLNRSSKHRWGFVSNGLKLYVLRDNASLTRSANVEFDLESMMDGEYHADFTVLFLICHQSRLEIQATPIVDNKSTNKKAAKPAKTKKSASKVAEKLGKYELDLDDDSGDESELDVDEEAVEVEEPTRLGPENCWLEAWTKLAGEQGTRAKERLRDGVQLAIQTFGAGFYTCTSNAVLHERLRSGELSTQDYYRQLLRLVYRLLMLMVAEDKRTESGQNLLHPIDTPAHIRDRYNQFYSVGRIRKLANERRGTPHRDLYESLKTTFVKLRDGYPPLGIPGIGSFLFSDTATPDLDSAQITNEALLDAFRHLCFTDDATGRGGSIRRAVDFGNLGSEELGSIYESLLELHPEIDSQDRPFVLRTAAGNERKTSGSYYTPTSLINCLLDSALDPVVNQAIDVPDREEAKRRLLNLKVCDPACGSGHFLIAAANRMALHLARLETQDTEPTTLQIQHAKRQIIGRCIYGVDINEMAVELCKVSLWMEALEPGKPFSFLENHIKCGNSLLGATPRLLNEGIPDEAFNPIEGDDKTVCSQLKKDNKRERAEYKSGQGYLFEPFYKLGNIADRFAKLSAADDESLDAIADKQKQYEDLIRGTPYLNARFWADTWCSAFVWEKTDADLGRLCPTERRFREIERNPHAASPVVRESIQKLAGQYQFFHWHIAFPDVFPIGSDTETLNEDMGWNRGFDAILGNPPWERIQVESPKFFAQYRPDLLKLKRDKRTKAIAELERDAPDLLNRWQNERRVASGTTKLLKNSGVLTRSTVGNVNSYGAFAELAAILISPLGRVGMIVQSGIATDDSMKLLFSYFVESHRLMSLYDFENRHNFFTEVHPQFKFCLLTLCGTAAATTKSQFLFFGVDTSDVLDQRKVFTLSPGDIRNVNPNTLTCPIFRYASEAVLAQDVYRKHPVLDPDYRIGETSDRLWKVHIQRMYDMAYDASEFHTWGEIVDLGGADPIARFGWRPLYEAKFLHQFDHRFATCIGEAIHNQVPTNVRDTTLTEKSDPQFQIVSRYYLESDRCAERFSRGNWYRSWIVAGRQIARASDERTSIFAIAPFAGVSNSCYTFRLPEHSPQEISSFVANLNTYVFDWLARQKVGGANFSVFIIRQLPVVLLARYGTCFITGGDTVSYIACRVLELSYTAADVEAYARDLCHSGPPFAWSEDRRFQIRCELDAAYFHLYLGSKSEWGSSTGKDNREGVNDTLLEMFPTPRDAVSYIMDTFPIVRRKDEAKYGDYRTKQVILEIYDQMTEIIEANEAVRVANPGKSEEELRPLLRSYQSPLNPPPGPPTDAIGNFIPVSEWDPTDWPSHIHPPKDDSLGIAVFRKPEQWGLRGDPYLWREIHRKLIDEGMPTDEQRFAQKVEAAFSELTGGTLDREDSIFVERYRHGGMSSGHVDPTWWRNEGIPLLCRQFRTAHLTVTSAIANSDEDMLD
jgi:hypothetical protein